MNSVDDALAMLEGFLYGYEHHIEAVKKVRAELLKLRQRDVAWWRAASAIHNAAPDTDEERKAWADFDGLRTGHDWTDVPEPFAKVLCNQRDAALAERDKLREFIRYWSYCTYNGMMKWCPEKEKELVEVLSELGIGPYAKPETDAV